MKKEGQRLPRRPDTQLRLVDGVAAGAPAAREQGYKLPSAAVPSLAVPSAAPAMPSVAAAVPPAAAASLVLQLPPCAAFRRGLYGSPALPPGPPRGDDVARTRSAAAASARL